MIWNSNSLNPGIAIYRPTIKPPLLFVFAPQSQGAMPEISLFQAERIASVAIVSDERSGTAAQFAHYHAATAIVCHFGSLPITTGCAVGHGAVDVDAPGGIGDRPGAGSGRSEDLQGKCRAVTAPIGMANDRQLEHLRTPAPLGAATADHGAAPAPAAHPGAKRLQRLAILLWRSLRLQLPGSGRLGWLLGYRSTGGWHQPRRG